MEVFSSGLLLTVHRIDYNDINKDYLMIIQMLITRYRFKCSMYTFIIVW